MITCKHCNTENPENSVYCNLCGKRLDGNKLCRKCEKLIPENAVFCNYCGTRTDTAEQTETAVKRGTSKPNARVVEREAPTTTDGTVNEASGEITATSISWRRIVGTIGTSLALLTSVITLVFVFLIGFGVNGTDEFNYIWRQLGLSGVGDISIYDFFGKNYESIQVILDNNRFDDTNVVMYVNHLKASLYINAVLGTVISALTLLSVTALAIAAIVKNAQKLSGKDVKHAEALSVAVFIAYVIGAGGLYALNAVSASATAVDSYVGARITVKGSLTFNGATVAGIVIGAVFNFFSIACNTAANYRATSVAKYVVNMSLTAVGIAFVGIAMNYAYNPTFTVKISENANTVIMGIPVSAWAQSYGKSLGATLDTLDGTYALLIVTEFLQIALTVVSGITIMIFIKNLSANKSSSNLAMTIATFALATAYLVIGQIAASKTIESDSSAGAKVTVAYAIVSVVFGALTLVLTIVKMTLFKTPKPVAAKPTEAIETTAE